jgi:group I intron endonuclease
MVNIKENFMFTIYKVTNKINGKAYIGFDSNWPSRKSVHICEATKRQNKKYPLYRALRKYGIDSFVWEVLYQNNDRQYTLNVMENKMIVEHNTHFIQGHGYNMTFGGEGTLGWIPSKETRRKIGIANSRSTLTEHGRKIKSEFTKKNNPMNNQESREKHRLRLLEVKPGAKKVTDGNKIFESIRDANKQYIHIKYQTLYHWIKNNKNGWSYVSTK